MEGRHSAPVQLTQQLKCDHALAGARAAGDDDDLLAVGPPGLLHRVEHHAVRHLLLVQEYELPALPYLLGGHGHELLRRHRRTRQEFVRRPGAGVPVAQLCAEVIEQFATALPCEQQPAVIALDLSQAGDTELGGVVQVRHSADPVSVSGQRSVEVHQVLAVAPHLLDGVEDRVGVAFHVAQRGIVLVGQRLAPLFEFHHDVGGFPGRGVHAGKDDVGALAVQRERVLQHHLDVPQSGVVERSRQDGKAALPGAHLRGSGPVAVHMGELVGEVQEQRTVERHDGDRFRGRTEQQELPPGSTK